MNAQTIYHANVGRYIDELGCGLRQPEVPVAQLRVRQRDGAEFTYLSG